MDANDLVNALEGVLGLGDTLDNSGAGMLTASNGQHSTRDVIKLELGQFLLYIGDGASFFTDGQAALVNLCFSDKYGEQPAWRMKSIAADIDAPDPDSNASFVVFNTADEALSQQNGEETHKLAQLLISLYESFGNLMVAFNENALSRIRYENFMTGLRARIGSFDAVKPEPVKPVVSESRTKTTSKSGSSKSSSPVLSGNSILFGKNVKIELKNGCICTEGKADNGKDYIELKYGSFSGSVGYADAIYKQKLELKRGETGIEAVHRMGITNGGWVRWSELPEIELHLQTINTAFMKAFSLVLLIQTEENKLPVTLNVNSGWYDDDMEWNFQAYHLMAEMISMVRVNGSPIPDHGLSGEQLMELMKPDFDRDKGQIILPDDVTGYDNKKENTNNELKKKCEKFGCAVLGTTLSECTNKDITEVKIPDGITQIGNDTFKGCKKLKKVILPDSLKAIQSRAFSGCRALKEIDIPDSVTILGGWAFEGCSSLERVRMPAGITTVKLQLFSGCVELKEVEIPDNVTIIENEVFNGCDNLQTVSLPDRKIDIDKTAIPDHVRVIRRKADGNQPEETTAGKVARKTGKEAPKKKTSAGGNGKEFRYDENVSFELTKGFDFLDETDDKGERNVQIGLNPKKENGEISYDRKIMVSVTESDDDEDVLDMLDNSNKSAGILRRFDSDPEASLICSESESAIFGVSFVVRIMALNIRISDSKALSLRLVGGGAGEQKEQFDEELSQLMSVWRTVIINGEKVSAEANISDNILREHEELQQQTAEADETKLDNRIQIDDGKTIRIGDRWEMMLPFGWRAKTRQDDDSDITYLTIYMGSLPSGHCVLGNSIGMQKKAVVALNASLLEKTLKSAKLVEEETIREDDRLNVNVTCFVSVEGTTIARIKIIEKELRDNENEIDLILTNSFDDVEAAFQKIKDKEYFMGHPFGVEFENKWMGALKLAASIRPVGEQVKDIELQERTEFYKGITGCIPKGMKLLKGGEDEADFYYPAKGKPNETDFQNNNWDCFLKVMKIDGAEIEAIDGMSANVQAGINARLMARINDGPAVERIQECYTETGYKSLWLSPVEHKACLTVATGIFDEIVIEIISDTDKSVVDLLRTGQAIYDTIEINGESENVCAPPFPPDTQLFHEHYDLVESGQYTTHRDADFVGQSIRELMDKHDSEDEDAYDEMQIEDDEYTLDRDAISLAKVFRLDESLFDPYGDTEALIRKAMFKNAGAFQALRSLAWSVSAMAEREGRTLDDYSYEELEKIGDVIVENNNINYQAYSYCAGLCNHYDWHVFYVPDAYLQGEISHSTDLRYLTGKENRGGNSITIVGFGGFGNMNRVSDLISRNEETLESLEAMRKDLEDMLPVMQTIYNGLMVNRNRSEKLEGPLADALTAWCALAIAAKEPFYSEEAASTYEADGGLDGPLERPTDKLDDKPVSKVKTTAAKTTASKAAVKKPETKPGIRPAAKPVGDMLDLGGATVIKPGQFSGNMNLKNIIIPDGVTEIGEMAFYSCMYLESVVFPKTLKKIGKMAFMSCRALKKAELPDGIEEIGDHAFGATNNLKEMRLPDSLQTVDNYLFGMGGDSPYATAYMSGALACRLMETANQEKSWPSDAIYARHYVIDGVGYEQMTDFWEKVKDGSVKVAPASKPKMITGTASTKSKTAGSGEKKETGTKAGIKAPKTKSVSTSATAKNSVRYGPTIDPYIPKGVTLTDNQLEYLKAIAAEINEKGSADTFIVSLRMKKTQSQVSSAVSTLIRKGILDKNEDAKIIFAETEDDEPEETIKTKPAEDKASVPKKQPVKKASTSSGSEKSKATSKTKTAGTPKTTSTKAPKEMSVYSSEYQRAMKSRLLPGEKELPPEIYCREIDFRAGDIAENGIRFNMLKDNGPVIEEHKYWKETIKGAYLEIPEGVTEIANYAFTDSNIQIVKLPRSLRKTGQGIFAGCQNLRKIIFQEGLKEIGPILCENCPNVTELHLPGTLEKADEEAFSGELFTGQSNITVHMTGTMAKRIYTNAKNGDLDPPYAKSFVIDGSTYRTIEEYIRNPRPQPKPQSAVTSARTSSASPAAKAESAEEQRKRGLQNRIRELEQERDAAKGLFAGMKRKKIQKEIDALREKL